jgi:hypothetical protein
MTAPCPWAMQREAAARLGISERTLHRWRSADLLQAGVHYRRKFPNPNSPLLYHLECCEQAMNEAAARHPGRLEVAPLSSSQSRSQPMEVAPTAGARSLRGVCLPPTPHRTPQGQPRQDAQPLADSGVHPVSGAIAEHLRGIHGHRPRVRLRRGQRVG